MMRDRRLRNIHRNICGLERLLDRWRAKAAARPFRNLWRGRKAQPHVRRPYCFAPSGFPLRILWLWRDTDDVERIAAHAQSTFWYVLPTLPMFLVLPAMLRGGSDSGPA